MSMHDLTTWRMLAALPFLPAGKGGLILILGGLSVLATALFWAIFRDDRRSGPGAVGRARDPDAWTDGDWVGMLQGRARQAGVGNVRLLAHGSRGCRILVEGCASCRRGRRGPGRRRCVGVRRWLEAVVRTFARRARVLEVSCNAGGRGACAFEIDLGRRARRRARRAARREARARARLDPLGRERGSPTRRFTSASAGLVVGALCGFATYWIGAAIAAAGDLARAPVATLPEEFSRPLHTFTYWEGVLVAVGAVIGILVHRYRWRIAGLGSFVGLLSLTAGYFAYSLAVSIPEVPPEERWLSYVLLAAEGAGLGLVLVFSFYSVDAATRRRWTRTPQKHPSSADFRPRVALEVPVFNEPADMVERTIEHLVRQDYPRDRFMVIVCDDSTDAQISTRLEAYCRHVGAHYQHRTDRRGFKAGALNKATARLPADVELVAIIDADYWVAPHFLRSIVGHFVDPTIGFVQTPQDYRNVHQSFLTRQYKRAEAYFYHAIMPSRNEENSIIFCGTMGVIRREALEEVGGFAEDQICEDAEVSVRLVAAGWNSLYVDQSFGKGIMPATFESYKKQFHRWAFGNVRILFSHTGLILRSRKMKARQKLDYLVSNLHWFDGFFVTAIAAVLLYLGLGPILGYDAVTHHQKELALLALVPTFLIVDSVTRLHLVLRRSGHVRWRDAILVQGMWFAIKFTNLVAVIKCMLGFRTPFVRTPKDPGKPLGRVHALLRAVRITKFESLVGAALVTVAAWDVRVLDRSDLGWILLPAWLALYGLFFLCAPIYAYLSYRTLGPENQASPAARRTPRPVRFHEVG